LRGQIASVLIVTALIAGVVIGYIGNASTTTTVTATYTLVTTRQGLTLERCTVTEYAVWSVESVAQGATVGGTTTQDHAVATFQTTGFQTTTTSTYTGTLTGAIDSWNVTVCS
jgi:hypothetical protein